MDVLNSLRQPPKERVFLTLLGLGIVAFSVALRLAGVVQGGTLIVRAIGGANVALMGLWLPTYKPVGPRRVITTIIFCAILASLILLVTVFVHLALVSIESIRQLGLASGVALLVVQIAYFFKRAQGAMPS
jgi:hypothetical protein